MNRWLGIGLMAILPAWLGLLCVNSMPQVLSARALDWQPPFLIISSIVLAMTAFVGICKVAGYRAQHFLVLWKPPAPVAGWVGGGVVCGALTGSFVTGFLVIGVSAVCFVVSAWISNKLTSDTRINNGTLAYDETPVNEPGRDAHGYNVKAERLARRIRSRCGPILIVGRYGSGKSSLTNLIFHHLCHGATDSKNSQKWERVTISGWGIADPEDRARTILSRICECLQNKVDVVGLREQCRGFIGDVFGNTHWLAKLFLGAHQGSSSEITQNLDEILKKLNIRVMLVLDDFERNAMTSDGTYDWHHGVSEVVDRLKSSKQICVVACVTKEALA